MVNRLRRVETFARAGYAARGVVYTLLGYFALKTLDAKSPTDVLAKINDMQLGSILLVLVALGLAAYGLYRLYSVALNLNGEKDELLGYAKRIGGAVSGFAHLLLAFVATKAALGSGPQQANGQEQQTGEAASQLIAIPGGQIVLIIIGVGFLFAAFQEGRKAYTGDFMRLLEAGAPPLTEYVGRAGYAARALVFTIIGWKIIEAALADDPENVGGVGLALRSLQENQTLFIIVAAGLLLFGVFSLLMARYRKIRDEDVINRLKSETREKVAQVKTRNQ